MKRAKLIMVALCTIFAAMLVVGCQNAASGSNDQGTQQGSGTTGGNSGSTGGTTTSSNVFAGTTWVLTTDSTKTLAFNANGTVTGAILTTSVEGVSYAYTVQNSTEAIISMVMDGVPISTMCKFVIDSATATTGGKVYMFMAGSFQTSPEPGEYSKQ